MPCSFQCSVIFPNGAVVWSAVGDFGISWSYLLTSYLSSDSISANKKYRGLHIHMCLPHYIRFFFEVLKSNYMYIVLERLN